MYPPDYRLVYTCDACGAEIRERDTFYSFMLDNRYCHLCENCVDVLEAEREDEDD